MQDYYVYVYIDPRNHEEFYYGKGVGSRKGSHLFEQGESDKLTRIADIRSEGLTPIIRVIARGLTESEALLVEKTLLWKLGKNTTNVSTGHFKDKFRPANTLHKELSGFDYRNGFFYFNVGDGAHRCWEDYREYSFISAGQGSQWRRAICAFNEGDVFVAYLKNHGFVGVGRITHRARRIGEVKVRGISLLAHALKCQGMAENSDDEDLSEYVCLVEWFASVPREEARWKANSGLYTTPLIRASLDAQPETRQFVQQEFKVEIATLIK